MITIPSESRWRYRDIILRAFRLLRGAESEKPTNALDLENGLMALQGMAATWQTEDLGLWMDDEVSLPLCCAQTEYRVDRYLRIRNVRRRDSSGIDILMGNNGTPMSRAEYMALPSKTAQGTPIQVYYWMAPTHGKVTVWPAPSSDDTWDMVFTARLPFRDFPLDGVCDFPPEWMDAICYNLAVSLAAEYPGETLSPVVAARAAEAKDRLAGFDTDPGSTYIQPVIRR